MKWKLPPKAKILEALGSIGDQRIEVSGDAAKVYSSSLGKFYTVTYDKDSRAIMTNDNASFWQGYLGYPAITYLLAIGEIHYDSKFADALAGIKWKDINTQFKNDWDKTDSYAKEYVIAKGIKSDELEKEVDNIYAKLQELDLSLLSPKTKPPTGY